MYYCEKQLHHLQLIQNAASHFNTHFNLKEYMTPFLLDTLCPLYNS